MSSKWSSAIHLNCGRITKHLLLRRTKYISMTLFTAILPSVNSYYEWLDDIDNYNDFFHPNICHVCKRTNVGELISCDQCYMISYCSDAHKSKHYVEHQHFCNIITRYFQEKNMEWRFFCLPTFEWIEERWHILYEIELKYRNLSFYEKEMVIFAKSCFFCHIQTNLHSCKTCYSDYFCDDHKTTFLHYHTSKCNELKLCLNSNILNLNFKDFYLFAPFPNNETSIKDMNSFIMKYMQHYQHNEHELWTNVEYIYSDYASGPLTLYDGMKKAGLLSIVDKEECVIHIILVTFLERKYVLAWELLLHLLHRIKHLIIVLVGTELQNESFIIPTCTQCNKRGQILRIECYSVLYNEYSANVSFRKPNIIIAFQVHFDSYTWSWHGRNLLTPQCMKYPCFFTAESQSIAEENKKSIQTVVKHANLKYNAPNTFKSNIPCRLLHTDCIGYRNSYITIYEQLELKLKETFI